MRRTYPVLGRGLVVLLALILATGSVWAQATPRIGYLTAYSQEGAVNVINAMKRELATLGWVEGRNVEWLEPVSSGGSSDNLAQLASLMVAANPAVIVAQSADVARALKQATPRLPIVMLGVGEPVDYGLVASLTRPGGNITGTASMPNEVGAKMLQILREAAPHVREVGVPTNPANPGAAGYWRTISAAAPSLGMKLRQYSVQTEDSVEAAMAAMRAFNIDGMLLSPEARVISLRPRFTAFALQHRVALVQHGSLNLLGPGILATGGPAGSDSLRVMVGYIDKILKGAPPGELPIWRPVAFELGLNLKAAERLGITLPQSLVGRADRIVEE